MLSRIHSSIALPVLASISFLAGCIITSGDGRSGTDNGDGGSGGTITTTSGGGEGGSGGDTGAGGDTTVGVGGGGGEGGSAPAKCALDEDNGKDVNSCKAMDITPESGGGAASQCGDQANPYDPPGYTTCLTAFEVYKDGAAQHLQACLSKITVEPANACDDAQNEACIQAMYDASSDALCSAHITEAETGCKDFATECQKINDTSMNDAAVKACTYLMTPLTSTAVEKLNDCLGTADPQLDCKGAFDFCEAEIRQ